MDAFGDFYGTTATAPHGFGSVFEIKSGSSTATTLVAFNGTNGQNPQGGLTIDGSGNVFGATAGSGGSTYGTVFEIPAGSNTITTVVSFDRNMTGAGPFITLDASGNIYGTTETGGTPPSGYAGYGTVFEVAKGSSTITTFATFIGDDGPNPTGANPFCPPTLDSSGNLYGTTSSGGTSNDGTVFEVAKGSNTITTLASFNGTNGLTPGGGVTLDTSGNLYGTTYKGGAHNTGTFFEIPAGSALTTLASFDGTSGKYPYGSVTLDGAGNLYGTTSAGGDSNDGTVFEIPSGSTTSTALACFNGTNGANPEAGLTMDASGNLFGTTYGGTGNASGGTVFEIAKGSNTITTLGLFNNIGAFNPRGEVALDAAGNLYGTTYSGGGGPSYSDGTVYELAKGSNTITILAQFNGTNGAQPFGKMAMDGAGNLFGTTAYGGANNGGTVFEVAAGSKAITTLASFGGSNGSSPEAGPTLDASGNLYGTTYSGTVFELANGSNTITTVASIPGPANAGVTLDASGDLFGTTAPPGGTTSGSGTVFEIPAGSNTATVLASLVSTPQTYCQVGGITRDGQGHLFGMIEYGGTSSGAVSSSGFALGVGAVFELVPAPTVTLTLARGSNPSTTSQPLTFTATMSGGVPDGETVTLQDASNNNAIIATGTLSGGSATLAVPAGTLSVGTHNLVAVYGGDASFAASASAAYAQTVQAAPPPPALAGTPLINGDNPNGLFNAPGQPNPGVQRSMVEDIVYTFNEAVTIPDANAAFTVVGAGSHAGTAPSTLIATAVPGSNGTQWAVGLTGKADGVLASIANGEYSITLNPNAVFAAADGTTAMTTGRTDTFYRLFGDINGDRVVNVSDEFQFSKAMTAYTPIFDVNGDGAINLADEFQASKSFSSGGYVGDGFVTSI